MSITSINGNGYWYTPAALLDKDSNGSEQSRVDSLLGGKSEEQDSPVKQAISPGRRQVQAYANAGSALAALRENGTAITRESVAAELERRELEFELLVSSSLKAMGIDEKIEFKLGLDSSGKLIVNSAHPDRERVQAFFDNTPALADKVKDIESLRNLSRSMESSPVSMISLRRSLQLENLNAFFEGLEKTEQSYGSLILSYSNSSLTALTGLNINV